MQRKDGVRVTEFEKWCLRGAAVSVSRTLSCPSDNYKLVSQSYCIPPQFLPTPSDDLAISPFSPSALLAGNSFTFCSCFVNQVFSYLLRPLWHSLVRPMGNKLSNFIKHNMLKFALIAVPMIIDLPLSYLKINSVLKFDSNALAIGQLSDMGKFYNGILTHIAAHYVQQWIYPQVYMRFGPVNAQFVLSLFMFPLDLLKTRQTITGETALTAAKALISENSWKSIFKGVGYFTISNIISTVTYRWLYRYLGYILYPKFKKSLYAYKEWRFIKGQRAKIASYRNKRHVILLQGIDNVMQDSKGNIKGDLINICKVIEMYLDIYMQNQDIFEEKLTDSYAVNRSKLFGISITSKEIDYYFNEKDEFFRVNIASNHKKKE